MLDKKHIRLFRVITVRLIAVLLGLGLFADLSFGQCSTVTAKPSAPTFPNCTSLTPLNATNGDMSNNANHGYCASTNVGQNVSNGNASTILWVLSGQTISINNFQSSGGATIIIQSGGILNLNGNMDNAGKIHVYGTLNFTATDAQHQSTGFLYIASGGIVNATNFKLNGNGKIRNEGTMNTTTFQVQSASNTAICMNNGGCVMMNSFNGIEHEAFDNNSGNGYVYYNNSTCPTGNKSITTTTTLNVCAKVPVSGGTAGTSSSPCVKFGTAKVKYGCELSGASSTCAGAIALPITLTFFKPTLTNEGVIVKWGTNSQWDSDYFIIEKSKNGIDWEYVNTVPSENGKYRYKEFSVTDPNPYEGDSYYRLVEVDNNGTRTVYATDFIHNDKSFAGFSIYPNPSNGSFIVSISGDSPQYQMSVFDVMGKSLGVFTLSAGKNEISTALPAGIYLAKLKVGQDYFTRTLIVQ